LRFNWNAAIAQDPFDPATVYYGSQFVHKSTDRGATWSVISGDLTSNNPLWQTFTQSGGLTPDVTAAENFTTIVSIAASPIEAGTLWVGTDDGRVHVTRDGGQNWSRIDQKAKGVPGGSWVPMITPSPHDGGTAFVVFDNHRRSDMKPYAYRVEEYGSSWTSLVSGDVSGYALSILQDHVDPELLFLGTEFGLFISTNSGKDWTKFTAGVPTVSVMDMAIQERENDLVLGTHGRSIFVLDDYSALRGLEAASFTERLAIRSTTPGQQYDANQTPSTRFTGSGEFRAANEPYGVMITFIASGDDLPHPDQDTERARNIRQRATAPRKEGDEEIDIPKVEMVITNAGGEVIRSRKQKVHQGVNRIIWGLERDGVRPMPGPEPADLEDGLPAGIQVLPGNYTVTLKLTSETGEAATSSHGVTVLPDPRSPFSADARQLNYRAMLELQEMSESAVLAVETIVNARADVDTAIKLIGKQQKQEPEEDPRLKALGEQATEIRKGLDELEKRFRTPPETRGIVYDDDKVANLISSAGNYTGSSQDAPTSTAAVYHDLARQALEEALAAVDEFMTGKLDVFSQSVADAGIGLFMR
jgi:hypothetical protein